MSESLNPWILEYLLNVAKDFGAKLFDAKPYPKKRKIQIIEFLTYPSEAQQDTFIWARISDKKHIATVKFTKKAVMDCQARSIGKQRLIQNKGAIAAISNFKPVSSRFPLEQGRMSNEAFIIFECDTVELLGSSGEATFGQPKGIEQDPEISLWSKGIAQGGGAGNVLKDRASEIEGKDSNNATALLPMSVSEPRPAPNAPTSEVIQRPFKRINDKDLETYKARWHFVEKDRLGYIGPDIEEQKHASEAENMRRSPPLTSDQDLGERCRSGTPISNWDHSPKAKARHQSMARKVPRPASPEPPAAEQTGPARVLVPNSDTSQSQSQKTTTRQILGGNVEETTGQLPWMTMGQVAQIMRATAEYRLRNKYK